MKNKLETIKYGAIALLMVEILLISGIMLGYVMIKGVI